MFYKDAEKLASTADLNTQSSADCVGSSVAIVDEVAAEVGRALLLLEAGDLDAAHNKVLPKKRGTGRD